MKQGFDAGDFVKRVGERLVGQFAEARHATSPSAVGAAMEAPVRDQLGKILPQGIAVGSGFVIDSYGGTSRQSDVVLYERDICPVFTVNDTPETTHYPCEGVIAVGEIKSAIATKDLTDAFQKAESVKQLRRHYTTHPLPSPSSGKKMYLERKYGAVTTPTVVNTKDRWHLTIARSDLEDQGPPRFLQSSCWQGNFHALDRMPVPALWAILSTHPNSTHQRSRRACWRRLTAACCTGRV